MPYISSEASPPQYPTIALPLDRPSWSQLFPLPPNKQILSAIKLNSCTDFHLVADLFKMQRISLVYNKQSCATDDGVWVPRTKILRREWQQGDWTGRNFRTSSVRWSRALPRLTCETCRCTAPRSSPPASVSTETATHGHQQRYCEHRSLAETEN